MQKLNLFRSDFGKHEDRPDESLFESVLAQLGIPKEKWDDIDEVAIEVFHFKVIF